VAALDDAAHRGRHIADNNCLAWGKGSETQIEPFYTFGRRKELEGGAVVEERCYAMIKRLSANQGGGDDMKTKMTRTKMTRAKARMIRAKTTGTARARVRAMTRNSPADQTGSTAK